MFSIDLEGIRTATGIPGRRPARVCAAGRSGHRRARDLPGRQS